MHWVWSPPGFFCTKRRSIGSSNACGSWYLSARLLRHLYLVQGKGKVLKQFIIQILGGGFNPVQKHWSHWIISWYFCKKIGKNAQHLEYYCASWKTYMYNMAWQTEKKPNKSALTATSCHLGSDGCFSRMFFDDAETVSQKTTTFEPRKKPSYFPLYWLFNGTPYNGLL